MHDDFRVGSKNPKVVTCLSPYMSGSGSVKEGGREPFRRSERLTQVFI